MIESKVYFYIIFILSVIHLLKNKEKINKEQFRDHMILYSCLELLPLLIYPVNKDELFNKYNLFGSFTGNYLVILMCVTVFHSVKILYIDWTKNKDK